MRLMTLIQRRFALREQDAEFVVGCGGWHLGDEVQGGSARSAGTVDTQSLDQDLHTVKSGGVSP